ncbi:MAG: metallophosphoesterase [Phycisphaeraceae bacterium]|nr:metallophosphoesterase [Phycisphaerae bacterium]MBX3393696.1 metallophosphoesterase [Phycisphaeraceae bacterium]
MDAPPPLPTTTPLPPAPGPLERIVIRHPSLPDSLRGLRILHLTDLHIRRRRPDTPFLRTLREALDKVQVDLALFTGDAMNYPGDETDAIGALRLLIPRIRATRGLFGVHGNHDSPVFRQMALSIPGIRWLQGEVVRFHGLPLTLTGPQDPEDFLGTLLAAREDDPAEHEPSPFRIAAAHYPTEIYPAAELGIHLLIAGHTHGGQIRASPNLAPHTSSDLPGSLASGILRLGNTLGCVSRGLGQAVIDVRIRCPPHAPVYILERGAFPPADRGQLTRLVKW